MGVNSEGAAAMTIRISVILLFLVSITAFSSAEIYKYRDADGVLRFTDNLQEVPEAQRPKVESFHEIKPKAASVEEAADKGAATADQGMAERQAAALNEEKALLDSEYAQLEADRKQLVELSQTEKTADEDAAFQQQVEDFNASIKAYEEKRQAFEEKVKAYNAGIQ
jgi:hypothetical protein